MTDDHPYYELPIRVTPAQLDRLRALAAAVNIDPATLATQLFEVGLAARESLADYYDPDDESDPETDAQLTQMYTRINGVKRRNGLK